MTMERLVLADTIHQFCITTFAFPWDTNGTLCPLLTCEFSFCYCLMKVILKLNFDLIVELSCNTLIKLMMYVGPLIHQPISSSAHDNSVSIKSKLCLITSALIFYYVNCQLFLFLGTSDIVINSSTQVISFS